MVGDLPLCISVLLNRLSDLPVSRLSISAYLVGEQLIQPQSPYVPLSLGDIRYIPVPPEIVHESIHESLFAEDNLPCYRCPDRFLPNPSSDKGAKGPFGLPSGAAELFEHPIYSQTGGPSGVACGGAIAAPLPFLRACNNPRPDGIQDYIPTYLEQVTVFLDKNGLISALKEMAGPFAPLVKELGIDAIELPHADGEIAVRSFD